MKPRKTNNKSSLTFSDLVLSIERVHEFCATHASKAVNISLTIRNWVIGRYIEEYERTGKDRARYGDMLMDKLSEALTKHGLSRCDRRELYRYRKFYISYPQIVEAMSPQLAKLTFRNSTKIVESVSPKLIYSGKYIVERLSFSHNEVYC